MSNTAVNIDAEKDALEPWWFTVEEAVTAKRKKDCLPAVEVLFDPIGRIALRAARRAAAQVWQGIDLPDDPMATLPTELIEQAGDALSEALLLTGIRAWKGVGDRHGNIAPVTEANLRIFLARPGRFEKLDAVYVRPFVLRELEKNASSLSPNGISAGATQEKATANRSARRSAKAGAKRSRKKAARPARTSNMNSAATTA
ncbi:hypothetical protein ACFOKF_16570 [Sphingobium rhizovicinum]|uniref:Tail assembly chaperone n=1 Tax=Sphingobium rhizovicinum TaxID=432308 RepID=A0ABV7NH29_9SPHN